MIPFGPLIESLHFAPILVATLAAMFLGFLWYGPFFGEVWMKLVKLNKADIKGPMWPYMVKGLVNTFIMITITSFFITAAGASTWLEGALAGGVLALGIVGPILFGQVNWELKPPKLFLINLSYYFVTLVVAGGIYAGWLV